MLDTEKLYKYLPMRIYLIIQNVNRNTLNATDEIRLRLNKPLSLTCGSKNITVNAEGRICDVGDGVRVTAEEMSECVSKLTRSSLYSFDDTIRNGYIPLESGMRAGVCGDAVSEKNRIKNFSQITSICLRISRFVPDAASGLAEYYRQNGLTGALAVSPPGKGKTTFLRSAAYLLSRGKKPFRVCIADERSELYVKEMDNGFVDVISNCRKADAMEIFIRTMSPQIVICDEISPFESESVIALQNSGICLIASCHGNGIEDVMAKKYISEMVDKKVFGVAVTLSNRSDHESEITVL